MKLFIVQLIECGHIMGVCDSLELAKEYIKGTCEVDGYSDNDFSIVVTDLISE